MSINMPSLFIHHRREKLLNAIAYFVGNTKYCHTLKLFKLLNFLDFEHYRQTGRSVTGLSYKAYPNGPVPPELYNDIKQESEEKTSALGVKETFDEMNEVLKREFTVKNDFDKTYFTPRELEIMDRLVFFFAEVKSDVMSAYSHDPKLPWGKIYRKGEGEGCAIPYKLALQAEPIVQSEPTIEEEEIQMLDEVFQGMELR